jgi:hypothetical protein
MSARDELAEVVADVVPQVMEYADAFGEIADAILAVGYRKHRTITDYYADNGTDALPAYAVILSNGKPCIKQGDGTFMDEVGGTWDFWEIALPATVLYEPEAAV